jgi:hypothetical protein
MKGFGGPRFQVTFQDISAIDIACPTLGVADPDPPNKIEYDVWIKFSSDSVLSSNADTSLQLFHSLKTNSNDCLARNDSQNDLNADQKLG